MGLSHVLRRCRVASVQHEGGVRATNGFTPSVENHSTDPTLFAELDRLYVTLTQRGTAPDILQAVVLTFSCDRSSVG